MDISKLAVSETAAIHLKNAKGEYMYDGKGNPSRIVVYGPGSTTYAAVEQRQSQRALKRMQDNDGKPAVASAEQRLKDTAEDLAAITHSFENFTYSPAGDKAGPELFEALYMDRKLGFITAQVSKGVADWGNFSEGSATS